MLAIAVVAAALLSELASNTAAANIVIPIFLAATAGQPSVGMVVALAATLGTSLGLMLPVSTPATAMVYGSGRLRLADMVRAGLLLDALGAAIIWAAVRWLGPLLAGGGPGGS